MAAPKHLQDKLEAAFLKKSAAPTKKNVNAWVDAYLEALSAAGFFENQAAQSKKEVE